MTNPAEPSASEAAMIPFKYIFLVFAIMAVSWFMGYIQGCCNINE